MAAVINSFDFARDGGWWSGSVAWADLPRLAGMLTQTHDGILMCELRGSRDNDGTHWLDLSVQGSAPVQCQRCLLPMYLALNLRRKLLLVAAGKPWPAGWTEETVLEDDSFDVIEAQPEQSLLELIEDEVLLAMPFSPRHAQCVLAAGVADSEELAAAGAVKSAGAVSPFAALAGLKLSNTLNKE